MSPRGNIIEFPIMDPQSWPQTHEEKVALAKKQAAEVKSEDERVYLEFFTPSQLIAYTPPADLLLCGDYHIVRGAITVVGGPPGVGKSRSLTKLAESGVLGYEWFGLKVHVQFKTLIIQNENGRLRLKRELQELAEPLLEDFVRITGPPPYGLCFWKQGFRDQLRAFTESFGPQLVAIDPWNAVARDERAKEYLETFDIIRDVLGVGDRSPAVVIAGHTRKPTLGERVNGRALLNLLAGSHTFGTVPRTAFVMQHASDDVTDNTVIFTCCKNNDGEMDAPTAWERANGEFIQIRSFDWAAWKRGETRDVFTVEKVVEIVGNEPKPPSKKILIEKIMEKGVPESSAYRKVAEAERAGRIKFQKGVKGYVVIEWQ